MTNRILPAGRAAATLLGPVIWAAHFIIVYALESVLCRTAAGHWHALVIAAVTVLAVVALAVHGGSQRRRLHIEGVDGFLARTALTLDGLSLLAIMLVSMAGLALPGCR
jgi:hypothetical protein